VRRKEFNALKCIVYFLFLCASACSGGNNSAELEQELLVQTRIQGRVVEQNSGEPIRDAVISTDPASEVVRSDFNGAFDITDGINGPGSFRVFVDHFAYDSQQATISVTANQITTVDFVLQSNALGLHANTSQIVLSENQDRETLRLSSNIQNTGYSVLSSDPWIVVSPQSGVISNRETAILEIRIDRSQLSNSPTVDSEIVINPDNGTRELVITIQIRNLVSESESVSVTESAPAADSEINSRQLDCRRPDIFRVGFDLPGADLVQFLDSLVFPRDIGQRGVQIINPLFFDSFVVEELGTLTIEHISGDTPNTTLDIFELDLNENIITLAQASGSTIGGSPTRIDFALLPGVYCYILRPTFGFFSVPENFMIRYAFAPSQ